MSDDPGGLANIGIRVVSMFAGFAGGIVGAWTDDKPSPSAWFLSGLCGALTANFLAQDAMHFFPSWVSEGGVGFAIGASAYGIIKMTRRYVASQAKANLGGGDKG